MNGQLMDYRRCLFRFLCFLEGIRRAGLRTVTTSRRQHHHETRSLLKNNNRKTTDLLNETIKGNSLYPTAPPPLLLCKRVINTRLPSARQLARDGCVPNACVFPKEVPYGGYTSSACPVTQPPCTRTIHLAASRLKSSHQTEASQQTGQSIIKLYASTSSTQLGLFFISSLKRYVRNNLCRLYSFKSWSLFKLS